MKGFNVLINNLAFTSCPSEFDLIDTNRKDDNENDKCCVYGFIDPDNAIKCQECFKKSLELEYKESESEV